MPTKTTIYNTIVISTILFKISMGICTGLEKLRIYKDVRIFLDERETAPKGQKTLTHNNDPPETPQPPYYLHTLIKPGGGVALPHTD